MNDEMKQAKLCYVDGPWAHFTTQELSKQWGDDWNDRPYECNAGTPYSWCGQDREEPWKIYMVAFYADFVSPSEGHRNSPFSVKDINSGAIAWLRSSQWNDDTVVVPAGTTLERFIELVDEFGGSVYISTKEL